MLENVGELRKGPSRPRRGIEGPEQGAAAIVRCTQRDRGAEVALFPAIGQCSAVGGAACSSEHKWGPHRNGVIRPGAYGGRPVAGGVDRGCAAPGATSDVV